MNTSDYPWTGFATSFQNAWGGVAAFLPRFIGAILLLIIGVLIADLIGRALAQIIRATKIDTLFHKAGAAPYFHRAGIRIDIGKFIGVIVKWFLIVVVLIQTLQILDLVAVTAFLESVLNYLPQVIVAVLIVLAGFVIGEFMEKIVSTGSRAASLGKPVFLGSVTRWAIWIFTALVALYQLGIATLLSETVLNGIVIALALAVGLAFGLGGQSAAADVIAKIRKEISDRDGHSQ
jgi:small-conductance mechanosensitive channel